MEYLIWPKARHGNSPIGPVIEATSEEEAVRLALEHGSDIFISELGYLPDPSDLTAEVVETR